MGDIIDGDSTSRSLISKNTKCRQWPITDGPVPHTPGLDATHHRLFVAAGSNQTLVKLEVDTSMNWQTGGKDTETGKSCASAGQRGGADDIYYDAATGRIYFTGSTGTVAVFKR